MRLDLHSLIGVAAIVFILCGVAEVVGEVLYKYVPAFRNRIDSIPDDDDETDVLKEFEVIVGNYETGEFDYKTAWAKNRESREISKAIGKLLNNVGYSNCMYSIYDGEHSDEHLNSFYSEFSRRISEY